MLAVSLSSEGITVAHGSSLRPSIETLVSRGRREGGSELGFIVQGWSECEGGRVCLVREKAAGLLLPGDGDTRTKNHKVRIPLFSSQGLTSLPLSDPVPACDSTRSRSHDL